MPEGCEVQAANLFEGLAERVGGLIKVVLRLLRVVCEEALQGASLISDPSAATLLADMQAW